MTDPVLYSKDPKTHIARLTFNRPDKLNALTMHMYDLMCEYLNDAAEDDDIKVIILKGNGGAFSSGQDMNEVYEWYNTPGDDRRPSQRRRLTVDRKTFGQYHELLFHNKVTIAQVEGFALGGGFEFLMSCDLTVVAEGTKVGMPATRFLGPVLGNLHLFFYRLGPVLAKDLLLTGRIALSDELAPHGCFTRFVAPSELESATEELAATVARMPADGIVIAKECYRLVEESMGLGLSEICSSLLHAYGTNLRFEKDEFNFVRTRAQNGVTKAFDLRDEFFAGKSSS
ncbi:enoyl-CoA hydratase/isomerase family protein [Sporichthya polymorpha]|uniref:enoyl-CoA hydratase/isomerase family protein n=1 Tax=Sporichthya polymorpha TaxID=35751 RepID=UPI0003668AD6|nr:enoyl-CoA hydratase/isomerase family protein [Sporichthya polymorpha]